MFNLSWSRWVNIIPLSQVCLRVILPFPEKIKYITVSIIQVCYSFRLSMYFLFFCFDNFWFSLQLKVASHVLFLGCAPAVQPHRPMFFRPAIVSLFSGFLALNLEQKIHLRWFFIYCPANGAIRLFSLVFNRKNKENVFCIHFIKYRVIYSKVDQHV